MAADTVSGKWISFTAGVQFPVIQFQSEKYRTSGDKVQVAGFYIQQQGKHPATCDLHPEPYSFFLKIT
jgi:hypothetical protein